MPQPARLANAVSYATESLALRAAADRRIIAFNLGMSLEVGGKSMRLPNWRESAGLAAAMLLGIAVCGPAPAQLAMDSVLATLNRLSIELPTTLIVNEPVRSPLQALSREPCDQKAIEELGAALEKVGRRREAATAHISFSATCPGHYAPSLRTAVNILLTLSDYTTAAAVASHLIALEPFNDNGYFLRAVANDRGGLLKQAIDDYVTAIELFGNKTQISSVAYLGMAREYEKLGQFCDAVLPIETWVSLNPARNDTSQTRAIIADYTAKGRCQPGAAGGEEVFRLGRQNNLVKLTVSINGVLGNLLLDTGATFVSLTATFAQKAKVQVDPDSTLHLHTANGIGDGKQGRAASIQLRSLAAKDVPVVVQSDAKAAYGDGVDGLLGMSFLSHFKVSIDTQAVRISSRKTK
jgi:clan AA aspartic protease (TIGR02281 family)